MKLFNAFLISLGITLAVMAVNYVYYLNNKWLLLCLTMHGGEITVQFGFGLVLSHIFAMRPEDHDSIRLRFEPISFVLTILVLTAIIYVVFRFIKRKG